MDLILRSLSLTIRLDCHTSLIRFTNDLFRTNKDRSLEFSDMILSIKHLRPQEILDKLTSDISIYMTLDVSLLYLLINYEHIAILKDKSIIDRHQYLLRDLFPDESYY